MSAPYCIVFAGVRGAIAEDDIALFEKRRHPIQLRARKAHLDFWWDKQSPDAPDYFFIVGKKLAALGPEDAHSVMIPREALVMAIDATAKKMKSAKFTVPVAIHCVYVED